MHPIPYGRQFISEEDIESVIKALRSDYLTQGPEIAGCGKDGCKDFSRQRCDWWERVGQHEDLP